MQRHLYVGAASTGDGERRCVHTWGGRAVGDTWMRRGGKLTR